jgi:hypothetical protein
LVLVESCLDAHNDACMMTLILLGILLSLQAERKNFTQIRSYALPLFVLTLAVLVKFTTAPLVILFVFLLIRKTLVETQTFSFENQYAYTGRLQGSPLHVHAPLHVGETFAVSLLSSNKGRLNIRWRRILSTFCIASTLCILTVLLFYAPFWIGHNLPAIVGSFSAAPSSNTAENSIMRIFVERVKLYGLPPHTSWLYRPVYSLTYRTTWDRINTLLLLGTLGLGAVLLWRTPTTRSLVVAGLIVFEAVLIVTPWFYSWYVVWIIALAALLLTERSYGRNKAILLFAFVFSASAFFPYIMPYYLQAVDSWLGTRYVLTAGPPVLVLLYFLIVKVTRRTRHANILPL